MSKPVPPSSKYLLLVTTIFVTTMVLASCGTHETATRIDYQMGERVTVGPLTYNVIETAWRSQLGTDFKTRIPDQRYLMVTVSVTNGGGKEISVPLLSLENSNGKVFQESDDGEGVDNWFGVLRTLNPAQTQQGRLLFDVPLSSYKLKLTDGGDTGAEKYAWVEIPLRMDSDFGVETPGLAPMTPTLKK